MQSPDTVDAYIASAPVDQGRPLEELRAMIRKHLPRAAESIGSSGFPVYIDEQGKWLAGFAWRTKGSMLYVMNTAVLDRYAEQLGPLRSGKSCIEWRATKRLSIQELSQLAEKMLSEI